VFAHLGGEVVVDAREVVAILNARHLHRSAEGRGLLNRATRGLGPGVRPRAVVVTMRGVYATATAPATVARRVAASASRRMSKTAER
jgi:hypothetical protein